MLDPRNTHEKKTLDPRNTHEIIFWIPDGTRPTTTRNPPSLAQSVDCSGKKKNENLSQIPDMLRKLRRRQKKWFTCMKKRVYVHQCLSALVCVYVGGDVACQNV